MKFFSGFGQILFNLARQELVPASFKMITFLITLSVEKEVVVLEKSLEKSLEFCIEAVRTLNYLKAYNSVYSLSLWVINGLYAFTSVSGSRLVHLCKGFRRALNLVPRAFP